MSAPGGGAKLLVRPMKRINLLGAMALGLVLGAPWDMAQGQTTPLERGRYTFPNMGSPDVLRRGTFLNWAGLSVGPNTPGSSANTGSRPGGTGSQLYGIGMAFGLTNDVQLGLTYTDFDDPVEIANTPDNDTAVFSTAFWGKYRFYRSQRFSASVEASVENYFLASRFFGTRNTSGGSARVYSLHLPLAWEAAKGLRLHFSPGVSLFPDKINGRDFYGTLPYIGAGVSYRLNRRFDVYATGAVPFGSGGNVITQAGAVDKIPVLALGGRFNVTPKVGLDAYVTNSFGDTPATRITGFWPDGDSLVIGARLNYTPGRGRGYRPSYRELGPPAAPRERRLQYHQMLNESADTLDAGRVRIFGLGGGDSHGGGGFSFGLEHDFELGLALEAYSNDGSLRNRTQRPSTGTRVMGTAKLRLLDQSRGDPLSVSGFGSLSRELKTTLGVLYLSLPSAYQVNDTLALLAEPKFGAYQGQRLYGATAGLNFEPFEGVQLIAEAGPIVGATGAVWSVGARAETPFAPVSVEVQASNAIGNYGIGSMIAQDNVRISAGVVLSLNARRLLLDLF